MAPLLLAAAATAAGAQELQISGGGDGHGVGMSQWGAYGYAEHGATDEQILAHYYTGTTLTTVPSTSVVSVLLRGNVASARVRGEDNVRDAAGHAHRLNPRTTYSFALDGAREVSLNGRALPAPIVLEPGPRPMRVLGAAQNGVSNGTYRGQIVLRAAVHGGMSVINRIRDDQYVMGVISGEEPSSWPAAALEAQAVAARTYGLTSTGPAGSGFNVYSNTQSQMYLGVHGETAATDAATTATAGQVVTYAGKPVITYFFSSSGGYTESIQNAFAGAQAEPWLVGVPDPYDTGPDHSWRYRMSFATAAAKLSGLVQGSFEGIEVLSRGVSPRVVTAEVLGSGGATPTTGSELAARFGLPSTWEDFSTVEPGGQVVPEPDKSGQSLLPPAPGAPTGPTGTSGPTGGTSAHR
ncbi:MAG TPA: SpoIID/LytB domain-containing protein [Solirubrobacteraceae bacterium]|nr:SpoIID/LytB domain-containing protein [Solirubrobacteraceae bacterium]